MSFIHAYINQDLPKVCTMVLLKIQIVKKNNSSTTLTSLIKTIFISKDGFYFSITMSLIFFIPLTSAVFIWCQEKSKETCHILLHFLLYILLPLFSMIRSTLIWKYLHVPHFILPSHPMCLFNMQEKIIFDTLLPASIFPTYFQLLYFGKLDTSKLTNLILFFFQLDKSLTFIFILGE